MVINITRRTWRRKWIRLHERCTNTKHNSAYYGIYDLGSEATCETQGQIANVLHQHANTAITMYKACVGDTINSTYLGGARQLYFNYFNRGNHI